MGVQLLSKLEQATGLKIPTLSNRLRKLGLEITNSGMYAYERPGCKSMDLKILMGLLEIAKAEGVSEREFLNMLKDEFGTQKNDPKKPGNSSR